ncbi:hypothetical protein ACF0H5_009286 [Mactra antiquata]
MVKLLSDICLNVIQISLDKVPNIGKYLPTLYKEKLIERLSNHNMLSPDYVCHVSNQLCSSTICRIDFYNCEQVNDNVLSLIEASKCRLEFLTIHACLNVTDQGILSCTRNQNELESIKLKKLRQITDASLTCIKSNKLKKVDLSNCSKLTFKGVKLLTEKNVAIEELYLGGIDDSIEHSKTKCINITKIAKNVGDNLKVLDTKLNQLCDECLKSLAADCHSIKRLNLHGSSRISGEALTMFSIGCPALEGLDLSYCSGLCQGASSEVFWTLPTSLTELSLTGLLLSDETIFVECLQRLHHLKSVKLCGVTALNDNTLKQVLQHIGGNLVSLDISGGLTEGLTDIGLEAIPLYCKSLEELTLKMLSQVTCVSLLPFFKNKDKAEKIRKLFLCSRVNSEVLQEVTKSCHNLEKLDLSGIQGVTDDTLYTIAENCPQLAEFGIKSCRQVTDSGVCELARCCPLKSLVLAGVNSLTDKSIFALANSCHYLHEIYLNGCAHISPAAVRYLVDCSIPRLYYQHVIPNAQPNQLMARNLDTGEFCRADLIYTG